MSQFPEFYATPFEVSEATTCADTKSFGFLSRNIHLANYTADDMWLNFQGNKPTTGVGFFMRSSSEKWLHDLPRPVAGIGAITTATSGRILHVTAFGE